MLKRVLGGAFLLLSALLGFLVAFAFFWTSLWWKELEIPSWVAGYPAVCGGIMAVFSVIALIGAIAALQGMSWPVALIGSFFAIPAGAVIFGLIGLILMIIAKDEFEGEAPPHGAYGHPPGYYPHPGQYPVPQQPPTMPPQQPPPPPPPQRPPPQQP